MGTRLQAASETWVFVLLMIKWWPNVVRFLAMLSYMVPLPGQLHISGTSLYVSGGTEVGIAGDLKVDRGGQLSGEGSLTMTGHLMAQAGKVAIQTLRLVGSGPTTLQSGRGQIGKLELAKTSFAPLKLKGDSFFVRELHFLNAFNFLQLADTWLDFETGSGFGPDRYIQTNGQGLVGRLLGSEPVLFPVGNAEFGYMPMTLQAGMESKPGIARVGLQSSGASKNAGESLSPIWHMASSTPVHMMLRWSKVSPLPIDVLHLDQLRLMGWNGAYWDRVGMDSISGNREHGTLRTRLLYPGEWLLFRLESDREPQRKPMHESSSMAIFSPFPNPSSSHFSLPLMLREAGTYTFQLTSVDGRVLSTWNQSLGEGYHEEKISAELFSGAGHYLVQVSSGKVAFTLPLLRVSP